MGLYLLMRTPRVKRWLLPPIFLTGVFFLTTFALAWSVIAEFFEAIAARDLAPLALDAGLWDRAVHGFASSRAALWIAEGGTFVVFLVLFSFVALWTFSIAYEFISGPFLDTIQGRIEERWFGADPRRALQPTPEISTSRAVWTTSICALVACACAVLWFVGSSRGSRVWILLAPISFFVASRRDTHYGAWLARVVGTEARSLLVTLEASMFAAGLMIALVWVAFLPIVGFPVFAAIAGFATSITLLDIPFTRRRWSFRQRIRFVFGHFLPVLALGVATSFVFVVPVIGPIVGLPAASVGGLWLVCRLDKSALRDA